MLRTLRVFMLLLLGGLSGLAQAHVEPPSTSPADLRNAYASLTALPGIPDAFKVNFNDPEVWLRTVTVQPTGTPEGGSCRVLVRINNLLAKVLIVQPPDAVNITEPPDASPALTWQVLLQRFGSQEPPDALVLTPSDGLTISLESASEKDKDGSCSANVLVLGTVYSNALSGELTPVSATDLRSRYVSLKATPELAGETKVSFSDPQVLVQGMDVIPTQLSETGECVVQARINDLLARIQISEPPGQIVGIDQPPGGIVGLEGVTLAGINEPPDAIVFTPQDVLKVELHSELRGKADEKDKDGTCASDILILGTVRDNGQ